MLLCYPWRDPARTSEDELLHSWSSAHNIWFKYTMSHCLGWYISSLHPIHINRTLPLHFNNMKCNFVPHFASICFRPFLTHRGDKVNADQCTLHHFLKIHVYVISSVSILTAYPPPRSDIDRMQALLLLPDYYSERSEFEICNFFEW